MSHDALLDGSPEPKPLRPLRPSSARMKNCGHKLKELSNLSHSWQLFQALSMLRNLSFLPHVSLSSCHTVASPPPLVKCIQSETASSVTRELRSMFATAAVTSRTSESVTLTTLVMLAQKKCPWLALDLWTSPSAPAKTLTFFA